MFYIIWVHSGPFGGLTKLGAKLAELVQKFVPQSRVGIFHNERTRPTPFNPKLMFWCILYHLGAFATIRLPYKTRGKTFMNKCKSSWHEDVSEFFATNAPDPPHWTLNTCFGAFHFLRSFGTVRLPYKTRGKTFRISAKVRATRSRRSF